VTGLHAALHPQCGGAAVWDTYARNIVLRRLCMQHTVCRGATACMALCPW